MKFFSNFFHTKTKSVRPSVYFRGPTENELVDLLFREFNIEVLKKTPRSRPSTYYDRDEKKSYETKQEFVEWTLKKEQLEFLILRLNGDFIEIFFTGDEKTDAVLLSIWREIDVIYLDLKVKLPRKSRVRETLQRIITDPELQHFHWSEGDDRGNTIYFRATRSGVVIFLTGYQWDDLGTGLSATVSVPIKYFPNILEPEQKILNRPTDQCIVQAATLKPFEKYFSN